MGEFQGNKRTNRLSHDHAEDDRDREFEIAVEREKDKKNQENSERSDDGKLSLGLQKFTVFAAPIETVALRKRDAFGDGLLPSLEPCPRDCAPQSKTGCRCSASCFRGR